MDDERAPPRRDRLGCATLALACLGCITLPLGIIVLAWVFLVSLVMVIGAARDGRRVSRLAAAALVVSVAGPLLYGLVAGYRQT